MEMLLGNTPLDIYCDKRQIKENTDIDTEILLRGYLLLNSIISQIILISCLVSESIPKIISNIESIGAKKLLEEILVAVSNADTEGCPLNTNKSLKIYSFVSDSRE